MRCINSPFSQGPSGPGAETVSQGVKGLKGRNESLLPQMGDLPVGGRLQQFWQVWEQKGAPPSVVEMIKEGYILPFQKNSEKPPLIKEPSIQSSYKNIEKSNYFQVSNHFCISKENEERSKRARFHSLSALA